MTFAPVVRGAVCTAALDPAVGAEQGKVRPVIIVTNDGANGDAAVRGRGMISVVPVTSNVGRIRSFQVHISAGEGGLPRDSKAQIEQIRSIDVSRVIRPLGRLSDERMAEIDEALRVHLSL